jgi:Nucleotidyltransferase of unknown function (DUF6036)
VTRAQLEHVIRAAAAVSDDREIVVIGSQAVLGQFPDAPPEMLMSMEVDVFPRHHPERAGLIEGSIGELSPFHETFGYYAEGVSPHTAKLPAGWEERLVPVPVGDVRGLCLEINDLVLSKWAAGREKDGDFARVAVQHRMVERSTLLDRVQTMPLEPDHVARLRQAITAANWSRPDRP